MNSNFPLTSTHNLINTFFAYLKLSKQGLPATSDIKDIDSLMRISGRIECESPNRHLYDFVGNIRLDGHGYVKSVFIKTQSPLCHSVLLSVCQAWVHIIFLCSKYDHSKPFS